MLKLQSQAGDGRGERLFAQPKCQNNFFKSYLMETIEQLAEEKIFLRKIITGGL